MAARRKAERKAGIQRDPLSAACPFSTKLAREGFPHGKTLDSQISAGVIVRKRGERLEHRIERRVAQLKKHWRGVPLDPLTEEPIGFLGFAVELEARLRQGDNSTDW